MYPVRSHIAKQDRNTYKVDVWLEEGKYNAHAQKLFVDEYQAYQVVGFNTETQAVHDAVTNMVRIYE